MINARSLKEFLFSKKEPEYRFSQIFHAIFKEGKMRFGDMSVLSKPLRDLLDAHFSILSFTIDREVISPSGNTVKTLFKLHDEKLVEGVLMRFSDGRNSVCVSSQVGCGLKCAFCATGTMGFIRNLSDSEIADQVLYFDQYLKKEGKRVDHVVFMGMGEPLLNYENVMSAVRILNNPEYLGIAARNITISTSGVIPGIEKLSKEKLQVNLAISLHAPTQALRAKIMPIAKAYTLTALIEALERYISITKRRISYEYVMLKNINDGSGDANTLAKLIKGQRCHVNLIPYNETYLGFTNAGKSRIDAFRDILDSYNIPVTVRVSLGQDISAACGQLAVKAGVKKAAV